MPSLKSVNHLKEKVEKKRIEKGVIYFSVYIILHKFTSYIIEIKKCVHCGEEGHNSKLYTQCRLHAKSE
jgi:hypothetical protein